MGSATTTTIPPHELTKEFIARAAWKQGVLGAINVLVRVLAARLIVLVAVAGGIWLTWVALGDPNEFRLIAVAIYSVAVVIPVVVLAGRR